MHDCLKPLQNHPAADKSCIGFYTWLYTLQIQGRNQDILIHVYISMAIIGKVNNMEELDSLRSCSTSHHNQRWLERLKYINSDIFFTFFFIINVTNSNPTGECKEKFFEVHHSIFIPVHLFCKSETNSLLNIIMKVISFFRQNYTPEGMKHIQRMYSRVYTCLENHLIKTTSGHKWQKILPAS